MGSFTINCSYIHLRAALDSRQELEWETGSDMIPSRAFGVMAAKLESIVKEGWDLGFFP